MKTNTIKVFAPNSKRLAFRMLVPNTEKGAKKMGELLGASVERRVRSAFDSLASLGAETVTFREAGRKIKIEMGAH